MKKTTDGQHLMWYVKLQWLLFFLLIFVRYLLEKKEEVLLHVYLLDIRVWNKLITSVAMFNKAIAEGKEHVLFSGPWEGHS